MSEAPVNDAPLLTGPRRRFADIKPLEIDHPESTQEVLDYLRAERDEFPIPNNPRINSQQ